MNPSNKPTIIASFHQDAGLSNRLKNILSAIRISKITGSGIAIHWTKNFSCGAGFNDLFKNKIKLLENSDTDVIKRENKYIICEGNPGKIDKTKDYIFLNDWRFTTFPNDKDYPIDFKFEKTPKYLIKGYLSYLHKITPKRGIREAVDRFVREHKNFKEVIGLHIRRNEFYMNGRAQISSDDKFACRIAQLLEKNDRLKFFLATDSKNTEEVYRKKFGDKIIVFPKKETDRSKPRAIQEALTELLILSKTKHILGTYLSTFTEMAWWFGDCKAKVEIIGMEGIQKRHTKNARSLIKDGLSTTNQYLRRNSRIYRAILRGFGGWG